MKTLIAKVMKAKDAKVKDIPMIIVKNKMDLDESTKELELDLVTNLLKKLKLVFLQQALY